MPGRRGAPIGLVGVLALLLTSGIGFVFLAANWTTLAREREHAHAMKADLYNLAWAEQAELAAGGAFVPCGPIPARIPRVAANPFAPDPGFARLRFAPTEMVPCQYEFALIGAREGRAIARCDFDGYGATEYSLAVKAGEPLGEAEERPLRY